MSLNAPFDRLARPRRSPTRRVVAFLHADLLWRLHPHQRVGNAQPAYIGGARPLVAARIGDSPERTDADLRTSLITRARVAREQQQRARSR